MGVGFFDSVGESGDGAAGAYADEEVVEGSGLCDEFGGGEAVVGVAGVGVGVLVGPVGGVELGQEFLYAGQAGFEVAAGGVAEGDFFHVFAQEAELGFGGVVAVGVDDRDEGDGEHAAVEGQGQGEVAGG